MGNYIACVVAAAVEFAVVETLPSVPLRLVVRALAMAADELACRGEFAPFGLALRASDEIVTVSALSSAAVPRVEHLLELLETGLAAGRRTGRYIATALAHESDVPVAGTRSSIRVFELRLCENSSANTLLFPLILECGHGTFEWPHADRGSARV